MYHILIAEDDNDINQLLKRILTKAGYRVSQAFSGTEARLLAAMEEPDLMLLDLMLPGMSGEELICEIRGKSSLPILVLSAKGGLDDKVNAIRMGADDYVTKPFQQEEVLVRVEALLRRAGGQNPQPAKEEKRLLTAGELSMDTEGRTVRVCGKEISLTSHEFDILQVLLENPKKVFSKDALYEAVWKSGYYGEDNTVSVHVSNLRKKIGACTDREYIQTVWGIGYRLGGDVS